MADAKRFAKGRSAAHISVAVIDQHGKRHGFGGRRPYAMASTYKVMLLDAYLRQRSVRHRSLRHADKRLLNPMIRKSDSVAATEVNDMLGAGPIERLARHAHMLSFHRDPVWGLSQSSARDEALLMHRLQRLTPDRHWRYVKHLLSTITPSQRWGIGDINTHGWRLFFKGGWGSGTGLVDHQAALLRRGKRQISLAVMTANDPDHEYGKHTLRGVARRLVAALPRHRH